VGGAGDGGVGAPALARSSRSVFNFSNCSATISLYFASSTAATQCFFNSLLNSSEDSKNFFFFA
jgi:hypothetical protein